MQTRGLGRRNGSYAARRPVRPRPDGAPLKVAFYGPWNYDNGLGFAARGTIAALQRSGVRLNLHPIKKPFHVRQVIEAVEDAMAVVY